METDSETNNLKCGNESRGVRRRDLVCEEDRPSMAQPEEQRPQHLHQPPTRQNSKIRQRLRARHLEAANRIA